MIPIPTLLNCRGRLLSIEQPLIMGILNVTPDSFSDGGQYDTIGKVLKRVGQMIEEGAAIIDIGGYSSRPGAVDIPLEEELRRLEGVVPAIVREFPDTILSIDSFRSGVAIPMLGLGAHIINDITAGLHDPEMFGLAARNQAPIVLMHMQGSPQTMQQAPAYRDVVGEVCNYFVERIRMAREAGCKDILIDPGFGFGKTLAHNWELFRNLEEFTVFGCPILIGISRKSMVYRLFDTVPGDVLELSTAMHLKALEAGVSVLRVHDVKAAKRAIQLHDVLRHGAV